MGQGESFDPLDPVLHEYFAGQLEPQAGRALAGFLRDGAAVRRAPLRRSARARRWSVAGMGLTAAAAVLLAAWDFEGLRRVANEAPRAEPAPAATARLAPKNDRGPIASKPARLGPGLKDPQSPVPRIATRSVETAGADAEGRLLLVERATRSRTIDEGTVLIGQTAVRKLRRQWWERVEWFDPAHGARLERFVPREELSFVAIPVN